MNRLTCLAAGLALLAVVILTASPAEAQGGKTPSVKEIMTKLNKKGGIFPTLATELKANPPQWDEIQKQTKEYAQKAELLGKNEPPSGSKPSWEKLTKEFAKNAKDMEAAATKKDKSGILAHTGKSKARAAPVMIRTAGKTVLFPRPTENSPWVLLLRVAAMWDGSAVVAALKSAGVTDVVWIPDSYLGTWESALRADASLRLIRVCREGEAIAVAAGLLLGGRRPIVLIQCTGLFEAGDALRNVVHDLKLPLFLVVGVRSYYAHQQDKSQDNCPVFTEPILQAWQIPYVLLDRSHTPDDLADAYRKAASEQRAGVALLAE